jgi:hypothetical protein
MLRDNPALAKLPVPLPDQSLATLSESPILLFGLTVHTAWGRFGEIQSTPGVARIPFLDRNVEMLLYAPHQENFEKAMWDSARAGPTKTHLSSLELMAAELATTPDQVKWWGSPIQNEAKSFLLAMKSLKMGDTRSIYFVNFGGWRGFQEGNPALLPYRVRLDLFDSEDRDYEIIISPKSGVGPSFSQAEVNAMVASLQPLPHN